MAGFTRELLIDIPPSEIVAFAIDPSNAPTLSPNTTSMVRLDDGALGVGSRFRETRVEGGRESSTELKLAHFDPERGYAMCATVNGIQVTYTYDVTSQPGGSRVHLRCEVVGRGLKRLVVPIVAKVMERMDGDQLDRLKHAIESR